MEVYILIEREQYANYQIVSVHKSMEGARASMLNVAQEFVANEIAGYCAFYDPTIDLLGPGDHDWLSWYEIELWPIEV